MKFKKAYLPTSLVLQRLGKYSEMWKMISLLNNTKQHFSKKKSDILMLFFEGRELHHTTVHGTNIQFICLYKEKIAVSRIPPNTEGASFHFVPPLPANRKLSWVKDAIWRLIEELFNPTISMTTSPPGLSSKLLYLLPTFAHQP